MLVGLSCRTEFTFVFLRALEKVSFVWPYCQGMQYCLVLLDLCIFAYLHSCNDDRHMKRCLGTLLPSVMINLQN